MKIAVISDVHSNYNALEKVICEIEKLDCHHKICLGDMVGYYDKPNEVIDCLKYYDFKCVKGNHDKFILGEIAYKTENERLYGINRHRKELSQANILFLKECPDYIDFQYKDKKYFFCHSLKSNCQIYLNCVEDILNNYNDIKTYDYYFHGHTHRKNYLNVNNHIIINPGSVGQQRDKSWKPSFGIMDTETNEWNVLSVEYDIKQYIHYLTKCGYDYKLLDIFTKK